MAAWCAACLFRLDPICAIQGTAIVGRQVYLGAMIGPAGGSKSLGVSPCGPEACWSALYAARNPRVARHLLIVVVAECHKL